MIPKDPTLDARCVQEYRLRHSECDCFGRMKLKSFFDYAQEIAGDDASLRGMGLETLLPRHQSWFLSRMKVEIHRYPTAGKTIRVTTWASGFDRLFACREFRFEEVEPSPEGQPRGKGALIARATSNWLLMDTAAMRILPADRLYGEKIFAIPPGEIAFPSLGKLPSLPEDTPSQPWKVRGTQIDVNGHLNNTEYASVLQDALGMGVYPAIFQLNYLKAVPPQATLCVACQQREGEGFLCTGRVEGALSFEAAGTLLNVEIGDNQNGI
ncbi:MAG: acyl-[acyl-carrier-protein] thioesterase [Oligosphaeraceae bacterium]